MKKSRELVNFRSGEVIDLDKATPSEITEALSLVIIKRKELQDIEKRVKQHIEAKGQLEFIENDSGTPTAIFGIAKVRKALRKSFDKKRFEEKATKEEKEVVAQADEIKDKYIKLTESITFY